MAIIEAYQRELVSDASLTRRTLRLVPEASLSWRPHPRSMTLSQLALHVADIPRWAAAVLHTDGYDVARQLSQPPQGPDTVSALEQAFDSGLAGFRAASEGLSDADLAARWELRDGRRVVLVLSREAALRRFILSHVVHHRAQLDVYLRLLAVPQQPAYDLLCDDAYRMRHTSGAPPP